MIETLEEHAIKSMEKRAMNVIECQGAYIKANIIIY